MPAPRRAVSLLGGLSLLTGGLAVAATAPASAVPAPTSTVFVNEIHYDNAGTDAGELVEIAGPSGTDLSGWSVVLYNGGNNAAYGTRSLTGTIPGAAGGYGTVALTYPANGIQNGNPDGVALVNGSGVVQFLSYGGTMTAAGGVADGLTSTDIGVAESSTTPAGQSLQLTGTGTTYGDFTWAAPATATPGATNTGQTFGAGNPDPDPDPDPEPEPTPVCGDPATPVHDVQGAGAASPLAGRSVSIEGVVTAVKPGLSGVFVQEEAADVDSDPRTSEGVFVFLGSRTAPAEGSLARVTGTVGERFGKTQLSATEVLPCDTAVAPVEATPVTFPLAEPTDLEQVEGMLVELTDELVISEYFNYARYGEVVVGLPLPGRDRLDTPTAVVEPGDEARALLAAYDRRTITIDDSSTRQNPTSIPHPGNGEPFSLDNRFRGGDTITGIQGVVDYDFDLYRLQPTTYGDYDAANPRPESAPEVGGDVKVASFNVLNYFLTLDQGGAKCGPTRTQDCRGANTATELERQRAKILAAISELDADVVGLMEMENTTGVEPAADLVEGLNDLLGEGTYDYVDTGVVGTDAIRLGFLYKPGTVTPVGDFDVLDSTDDPRFLDTRSRPMLTQTFDTVGGAGDSAGERFTVSVNHLKSKGSACSGDPDLGDGAGNCNQTRTAAAEAIVDHLATDPTGSDDPDRLVIGDLNSYDHEDPIDALVAGGYADQVKRFGGEYAYGYVFDGLVGYLDHALANASLAEQVTGTSEWHINADEPTLLDYDTSFKPTAPYAPDAFRSSDHDPVLVGLALDDGVELAVDATPRRVVADRTRVTVHADVTDADGAPLEGGTVTVLEDGVVLGTATVRDGEARVRVPVFSGTGEHELSVTYTGPDGVSSASTSVDVEVKPGR